MMDQLKQVAKRLHGLRDALELSIENMAKGCGISPQRLEQYESGTVDIPVSFLHQLACAYGVELTALLFDEEPKMSSYYITRNGKGVKVERTAAYSYQDLAAGFRDRNIAPFLVTITPNTSAGTRLTPNAHSGQEFNYIVEGNVEITVADKQTILHQGDSIMFDSSLPHSLRAIGDKPARMIAIIC
ncbi:MAG: cupin domain-containing protein [Muribaculum sp.]|nr:cupin domain-containing protein [Muribaculaceae bacterium]MCM1081648.1 cupin domain-containing protein [Muribaculum sp.]